MEAPLSIAEPIAIHVEDSSHVASARGELQRMAKRLGFRETRAGTVAIVATEAVSNIVKHARRGTLVARSLARRGAIGIEMLAIDSGPGMESLANSSRDGTSTTGSRGTGLGAIRRQAGEFEAYTRAAGGTILRMVVWDRDEVPAHDDYDIGAVALPKTGESVCGDAWGVELLKRGATILVADGLGHGVDASRASQSAVEVLRRHPDESAIGILDLAHSKLRSTRGAAVAVMRHELASGAVAFAGIGNISASILNGTARRAMVSHNGILGHNVARSQEFAYEWHRQALFVAHTDGLQTQWDLASFPGIEACHPAIIAALLVREHSRGRDDVTVVVARERAEGRQ
ncbi:MAG TPA: ATP-binding protein [Usitatibacter sp.]|nr:ATP-binding protein [Usitatibacter sp.]